MEALLAGPPILPPGVPDPPCARASDVHKASGAAQAAIRDLGFIEVSSKVVERALQ
jgi:hypothetical protein